MIRNRDRNRSTMINNNTNSRVTNSTNNKNIITNRFVHEQFLFAKLIVFLGTPSTRRTSPTGISRTRRISRTTCRTRRISGENIDTNMFGDNKNIFRNILNKLNMTKHNTNNMNTTNNKMVANRLNIKPNIPNIRNHTPRNINLFMTNMFQKVTNKSKMFLNKNTNNSSISNSVSRRVSSQIAYHVIRFCLRHATTVSAHLPCLCHKNSHVTHMIWVISCHMFSILSLIPSLHSIDLILLQIRAKKYYYNNIAEFLTNWSHIIFSIYIFPCTIRGLSLCRSKMVYFMWFSRKITIKKP